MNKILGWLGVFSLIFCLFSCNRQNTPAYRLAICAMFKDEAPWLKEWIVYHHNALGVNHFYLYNNDSSDNYREVLQPFIDVGLVELIEWASDPSHAMSGPFADFPWGPMQIGAYNDCLKNKAMGWAEWVAMIDIDEFIVPQTSARQFYRLLDDAKKRKKGSVCLHWRVFGTSDVEDLAPNELLTEKLTWRSRDDYPLNQRVKSIYRPEGVAYCLIHVADLKPNFGSVTLKPNDVCINHYWTRTGHFCLEKRQKSAQSDPELFEQLHQVDDRSILQYLRQITFSCR